MLLLASFAYFVPSATWNPVSRFALTSAVVDSGTLHLTGLANATGDRAQVGDRFYSDKAPIPAVLAVPAYFTLRHVHQALGRLPPDFNAIEVNGVAAATLELNSAFAQLLYLCSLSTAGLAGVLVGVLLMGLLARRFSPRVAIAAAALTVLGTPIFPYATSFYGHVPAGAFMIGAAWLLDRRELTARHAAGVSICLAAACGCEYIMAVPGLFLLGFGLARALPRKPVIAALLLAGLPVLGLLMAYHQVCFGHPLRTGYSFVQNPVFVAGHAEGFMGIGIPSPRALFLMLVGPSRGLFYVAPLAAVGAAGLVHYLWTRRDDRLVLVSVAAGTSLALVNAGYYMWWGGSSLGPRHLVPLLWVLGVGVAHALRRWPVAVTLVGVVSALQMLAFTAVGFEAPPDRETVFGYAWHHLIAGHVARLRGASNLGIMLGFAPAASLGPLLAVWLLGGRAIFLAGRQRPLERGEDTAASDGAVPAA